MEIMMYERTFLRCVFIVFVVPKSYYIFLCINCTDPYNKLETCNRMAMLVFQSRFLVFTNSNSILTSGLEILFQRDFL